MKRIAVFMMLALVCLPALALADAADDDSWNDDDDDDYVDTACENAANCIGYCFEKADAADKDECAYAESLTWLVEHCEFNFWDEEYNEMTLDELIADCNTCIGQCGDAYMGDDDDAADDDAATDDDDTAGGDDDETAGDDDNDDNDDSGGCDVSSGNSSILLTGIMVAIGLLSFFLGLRRRED